MAAELIVIAGPLKGSTIPVIQEDFVVGRDISNALCLDDQAVSRRHCIISRQSEKFQIRDLESRNGTLVNHTAIREKTLESGDQLTIGASTFLFVVTDLPVPEKNANAFEPETQTLVLRS